ncbi:MAG: hypothetical protein JWQ97_3389 [Phenylobacterium sp.]|nr:hypothetical protein [Phenylobacterium sp.]
MKRACGTCEWGVGTTRLAIGGLPSEPGCGVSETVGEDRRHVAPIRECREGPTWIEVREDHWCGRWRLREELIRSGAHLSSTEILKHFEKAPQ